jgi:hypothetical protein
LKRFLTIGRAGPERAIFEAALFNVCVVVARHGNGADRRDLPLPPRFLVDAYVWLALLKTQCC